MKKAADLLPNYNDYRALCKTPSSYRTTICNVKSATLFTDDAGDRLRFQITADRFLGKMIRIIVAKTFIGWKG
jgi:Pseudouridylate synthase